MSFLFRLSPPCLGVPKSKVSRFISRRRGMLYFWDKYKFAYRRRHHYFMRRVETENRWLEEPEVHPFRYPGFWGGNWGFENNNSGLQGPGSAGVNAESNSKPASTGSKGGARFGFGEMPSTEIPGYEDTKSSSKSRFTSSV